LFRVVLFTNGVIGWGKKLSYCIAFSLDGAEDVTRRYVRHPKYAAERNRSSESELLYIVGEIRDMRLETVSKVDRMRLNADRLAEQKELRRYVISTLVSELCSLSLYRLSDGTVGIVGDSPVSRESAENSVKRGEAALEPVNRQIH
jgi:peptide-N4-(N-acetyl-beta-glucosaminyl)asparagine amidase